MRDHRRLAAALLLMAGTLACAEGPAAPSDDAPASDTTRVALTDLAARTYKGFSGGLYPAVSNAPPTDHAAEGARRAALIRPLGPNGQPSSTGRIVLLSIGMSNTSQEFCGQSGYTTCDAWSFVGQAAADPAVNRSTLVIVNGAAGGQVAASWDSPGDANYDRIRTQGLVPLGLSEAQVQVVWMKVANSTPSRALPETSADAYALLESMGGVARALRQRYPNLRQVFVSSRVYGGFATTALNPEPYAYESGLAVKWLIEAQIEQSRQAGAGQGRARDVNHATAAPWLAWGPYLWAGDAASPRSDGFFWTREDFGSDGTHPSQSGRRKVGTLLLDFFKTSSFTACWFLEGRSCG